MINNKRPAPEGRSLGNRAWHTVYGLILEADRPIPGLPQHAPTPKADIRIFFDTEPEWLTEARTGHAQRWPSLTGGQDSAGSSRKVWSIESGRFLRVLYRDGTEFLLCRQNWQIWTTWPSNFVINDMAIYLIGPILGLCLALRGTTSLHASAIRVDGKAIAFLGGARAGKSTTAAAFSKRGFEVLSDDVLPLQPTARSIMVIPGYPSLRLWPASSTILYGNSETLPTLTPGWDKRYLELDPARNFSHRPALLGAIYYLSTRVASPHAPCITAISAADNLLTLVANTYSNLLLDLPMRAAEFRVLSQVSAHVPTRRATPHTSPDKLDALCDVILEDYALRAS